MNQNFITKWNEEQKSCFFFKTLRWKYTYFHDEENIDLSISIRFFSFTP